MASSIKSIPVLNNKVANDFVKRATAKEQANKGGKVDAAKLAKVREVLRRSK